MANDVREFEEKGGKPKLELANGVPTETRRFGCGKPVKLQKVPDVYHQ